MSVRSSRTAAATVTAAVALVSAASLALSSAAFAAAPKPSPEQVQSAAKAPAKAASPLTLKLGAPGTAPILPGHSRSITATVENTGNKKATFVINLGGTGKGAVAITNQDVRLGVATVHAPATSSTLDTEDDGVLGGFYPKGGQFGDAFTIPAHTSYSWKLTVTIGRSWPINDNGLDLGVSATYNQGAGSVGRSVAFKVGTAHTGGPVVTKLSGATRITAKAPAVETLTVTNRTGAKLPSLYEALSYSPDKLTPADQGVAFDVWTGKAWKAVPHNELDLRSGLANNASHSWKIRVRLVGRSAPRAHGGLTVYADGGVINRFQSWNAIKELLVTKS